MHRLFLLLPLALLVACGTAETLSPVAEADTKVVTQVVTQVVTVVVTATPRPATATPAAKPTPRATATPRPTKEPTPLPKGGKWETHEGTSSFDDSKTVILSLDAENSISGPVDNYTPNIILRCQEKQIEAYVNIGMQPDVETNNLDGATVRLRFDKEKAREENTGKSTDGVALFFNDPSKIIDEMLRHDTLTFGFTPFSASPVEATFDLRGLGNVIVPVQEACK